MFIYKEMTAVEFVNAFISSGQWGSIYTEESLVTIFNYLQNQAAKTGKPIKFDAYNICHEYSEETPEDIARFYYLGNADKQAVIDYLQRHEMYVGQTTHGTILYRALPC